MFSCDDCETEITIDMEIRYRGYSDEDGFYCWKATEEKLVGEYEWTADREDDLHLCDACSSEKAEA
jgi:hypothetical protein